MEKGDICEDEREVEEEEVTEGVEEDGRLVGRRIDTTVHAS